MHSTRNEEKEMPKTIIFDVDGTLWDARVQVLRAWDLAKRSLFGEPFVIDFDVFTGLFGKTMDEFASYLFPGLSREEAIEKGNQVLIAETKWLKEEPGVLYPGIPEMLRTLSKEHRLFIVSNCQKGYIEVLLESNQLEPYFSGHMCYGDTLTSKGQTIRTLMKKYDIEDAVYIGDTQGDADACKEAGIPFIYASYGFGHVNEDYPTVCSPAEIEACIHTMD